MTGRQDEDELLGLMHNAIAYSGYPILSQMDSNALTIRERSTLVGMLRRWPQCERRRVSGAWNGVERREWPKVYA